MDQEAQPAPVAPFTYNRGKVLLSCRYLGLQAYLAGETRHLLSGIAELGVSEANYGRMG